MNENAIVIGKNNVINPDLRYVLLKEQEGYIFRRIDNPIFGWNGHHATKELAVENFKGFRDHVVLEISF